MNSFSASPKVVQLRQLLAERFPDAHATRNPNDEFQVQTGLNALDAIGLEKGMLCEAVSERPSLGSALLLIRVLREIATRDGYPVLIDGRDTLDPHSLGMEACQRLLWIRCQQVTEAVKAADLLLRDGNLPLILMDLEWNSRRELGRLPSSSWYRLRNLVEKTNSTLLVVTPVRLISSAHLRLHLTTPFSPNDLDEREDRLADQLFLTVNRSRPNRVRTKTG